MDTNNINSEDASGIENAQKAVFTISEELPTSQVVKGYDFSHGLDYKKLLESYMTTGFQATNYARAVDIINNMLNWRLSEDLEFQAQNADKMDLTNPTRERTKIFLGYTSNLISSGLRENFLYLVKNRMVNVLVTTAGGIEEDFIKCLSHTYLGEFSLDGSDLRKRGLNRIGNLLAPNNNYRKFEDWIMPIFDAMLDEQKKGTLWTPSKVIHRLGKEINDPNSVYYWAYKNDIPVYCPAFTDGSIGDMLYFHSYKSPGLVIDIVSDIRAINNEAVYASKTGIIILGGGSMKHHICNANLMRNGAEYAVYINTGQEFDGSDAGARPDEAVSWGKIKPTAQSVKIYSDATLVFPLLVSQTFCVNNSFK
ncbi:putative deoxyhypusine synthase [Smittium mucronatum]|uniref:deoxyhypusine synthase n=1 Tax=Smittium mucronatum TaxID=133383 RepID=A0A1R0GZA7_9FUNG|nr:putative deoxyhypusine synthase [Smittium mucronatum]